MSTAPQPPNIPPQVPFKSNQPEFGDEQNKTISGLSDAMRAFANLMKILGAVFAVLAVVGVVMALLKQQPQGDTPGKFHLGAWGTVVGLAPFALLFLTFGFWAGGAAGSFRKIAETKNEDQWHLMNALGSLSKMFGLLRMLVIAALILLVVGAAVIGIGRMMGEQ